MYLRGGPLIKTTVLEQKLSSSSKTFSHFFESTFHRIMDSRFCYPQLFCNFLQCHTFIEVKLDRPQSCLLAAVALTVFLSTTTAEPSFPQHPATLLLLESALSPSSRNFLKPSENPHEKHSAVPLPQNMAGKYLSALPFFRTLRVLQLLRPPALHQYPISHSAILSPLRTFVLSQLYTAWIPISIVKHNIFYLFSILFLLNAQ